MKSIWAFEAWCGVLWLVLIIEAVGGERSSDKSCDFPAIYNFGDSNSDTGGTSAAFFPRAWPSGETYFNEPAGRTCNGRLIIDFIGK